MPSPIGHALGALTVGGWAAGRAATHTRTRALVLAGLGVAPDLDLLFGRHSMETHSIGAAVAAGVLAVVCRLPVASTRWRTFVTTTLAWFAHPVLDALGADGVAPFGVMMWWPFSREHVQGIEIFDPIMRRWWLDGFIAHNTAAVIREVLLLGPLAAASWWFTRLPRVRPERPG